MISVWQHAKVVFSSYNAFHRDASTTNDSATSTTADKEVQQHFLPVSEGKPGAG